MSRYFSYLNTAEQLILAYPTVLPLHHHLKQFFSAQKKYGSRDRKTIATLCYSYYRAVHALDEKLSIKEKIIQAVFLCGIDLPLFFETVSPDLCSVQQLPIEQKFDFLRIRIDNVFPLLNEVSQQIDTRAFSLSMLDQPSVFLRVRPGKEKQVTQKLSEAGHEFEWVGSRAIRLSGSPALAEIIQLNKEAVIQDLSSQKVFDPFMQFIPSGFNEMPPTVWDCCAASGGKSILMYDLLKGKVKLTVSDIRKSILYNLEQRMKEAAVNIYHKFSADLASRSGTSPDEKFSVVICDVPCSGSGTWARTPEQLVGADEAMIRGYASRQQTIVANVAGSVADEGFLIYITCSVFSKENEEITRYIESSLSFTKLYESYLPGYGQLADTMYTALFRKKR